MKDIPLSEITLRKYEKPINLEKRELIRKICLSLGLLQLGDSRDIIIDIIMVLIESRYENKRLSSEEIILRTNKIRKKYNLDAKGLTESNVRRQLKRLRDAMLVDKQNNFYSLHENESLRNIFEKNIEKFLVPQIVNRVKEYLEELEKDTDHNRYI